MIVSTLRTAWGTFERLKSRLFSGALILLYHRVVDLPGDPQLLSVTPDHFEEHLEVLRRAFCPMRLGALGSGKFPKRAVVVTFDDGYADNLIHAKRLLERFDIPAAVFVATGYTDSPKEFWWDDLERLLLLPGILPRSVRLGINGNTCDYELGENARYDQASYDRDRGWNVEMRGDPSCRHRVYRDLCRRLRALAEEKRRELLDRLSLAAAVETRGRPTHRALTLDELLSLAAGNLVEVGAHSVTHPVLSALSLAMQRQEVEASKRWLEEVLGRPVDQFAYPFGSRSDYDAATTEIVRNAGFKLACANFPGLVFCGTDPFQLPRIVVRDWDGDEFYRRLWGWLGG